LWHNVNLKLRIHIALVTIEISLSPKHFSRKTTAVLLLVSNIGIFIQIGQTMSPLVGMIMGSKSDWDTMQHAAQTLEGLGVPFDAKVLSAHRCPDAVIEYAGTAESRGLEVLIAAAGGAAHLAGVCAAKSALPVLGVPIESQSLRGLDSLLSIVQMPAGIPVGTLAIGKPGAINAALLAATMLGGKHPKFREAVRKYREEQTRKVLAQGDPREK